MKQTEEEGRTTVTNRVEGLLLFSLYLAGSEKLYTAFVRPPSQLFTWGGAYSLRVWVCLCGQRGVTLDTTHVKGK